MDAFTKLIDARARLATMLEAEKNNAPTHVSEQWTSIISQLSEAIAELQASRETTTLNLEAELARTTKQELKQSSPGPHPIKWGL